ncbi:MAG: hypothetical protein IT452_14335 [Planctomycetia bacterium]|nr:hypothetical protein [Planctomycetia bacterium]
MKRFILLFSVVPALACLADDPATRLQRLEDILRRADSDAVEAREAAAADLARWRDEAGDEAEAILEKAAAGRSPEVRGRIEEALRPFRETAADRKLLAMFEGMGLPEVKGLKYVEFNTGTYWVGQDGKSMAFQTVSGWAVETTDDHVRLATTDLEVRAFPRKRDLPKDWETLKEGCSNPEPKPGEFRELDFGQVLKAARDADVIQLWGGGEGPALAPALLALWAYQRGDRASGHALLQKALDFLKRDNRKEEESDAFLLASAAAGERKVSLICAAHAGASRTELRDGWNRLATLPPNRYSELVDQMSKGYEKQCREDEGFREVSEEDLGKLPAAERAAYWVHLLREVDSEQWSDPGSVSVLGWGTWRDEGKKEKPWPPAELVALRFDAIPALIEHLDDTSPTRAMGWWRSFAANSYYLLTMADACEEIFESVTGVNLYESRSTSGTMTRDGRAAAAKKAAREWWEEARRKTPEERLLDLLKQNLVQAATELIKGYGEKHLARVVEEVKKRPDHTGNLVSHLHKELGPEHAELLKAMLGAKDGHTLMNAAGALVRVSGDTAGVKEVPKRLQEPQPADSFDRIDLDRALPLLAKHEPAAGTDLVVEMLERNEERSDRDLFAAAPGFASPRILDALLPWLDRREESGTYYSDGYKPRWCDDAADAIARATGWPKGWKHSTDTKELDGWIGEIRKWVSENRESFDWEALRKKALEDPDRR